MDRPSLPALPAGSGQVAAQRERQVYRQGGQRVAYKVYARADFGSGDTIAGPAIISEHTATTVLHAGDSARIGSLGEIVISVAKEG